MADENAQAQGASNDKSTVQPEDPNSTPVGVYAPFPYSAEPFAELSEAAKGMLMELDNIATKTDTAARRLEVEQAWEPLDVDTLIPTPNGWTTQGALKVGDYVFGADGRIKSVVHEFSPQLLDSYRLEFSDGTFVVAGATHPWSVSTTLDKTVRICTTEEIFEKKEDRYNISLPTSGLQLPQADLLIDPYVLGCWLGDGYSNNSYLCGNLKDLTEITEVIKGLGYEVGEFTTDGGANSVVKDCCRAWIKGISKALRVLDLHNNKHIPKVYLRASREQRIALLQGLMDTDGWATDRGACGWGQCLDRKQLLDDVSELLTSLGVKHKFTLYTRNKTYKNTEKTFNYYQSSFSCSFPAFKLERKLAQQVCPKVNGRAGKVYIKDVVSVGKKAVKCVEVDSVDHLYLCGLSMIPTHNSLHFDRGYQHLLRGRQGGWVLPGNDTGFGGKEQQYRHSAHGTNVYGSKGDIIVSALSREIPKQEFFPMNPEYGPDIIAAEEAEKFKLIWARNNNLHALLVDCARIFWNEDRVLLWTRYELNGQKYGFEEDVKAPTVPEDLITPPNADPTGQEGEEEVLSAETSPSTEDQTSLVNEEMNDILGDGGEDDSQIVSEAAAGKKPLGREVTTAFGKLDHKVPIAVDCLAEMQFVQIMLDVDVAIARATFPWIAEKIKVGGDGNSESQLDRIARENVRQAVLGAYVTGDSLARHTTIKYTWLRPSFFLDEKVKDEVKAELFEKFPNGCLMAKAGSEFAFARNESVDDHIAIGHPSSGKGQNRRSMGASLISVQKLINDWVDLLDDFFKRTIPKKWYNADAFDLEAMKTSPNVPGSSGPFLPVPGLTAADQYIMVEPTPQPQAALPDFIKWFITSLSEEISGALPSLFGAATNLMDVNEVVPTTKGFLRNGDLVDGDEIFGEDGQIYEVEKAHPHKITQAYKVSFDDGTSTLVHDGHLWTTFTSKERSQLYRRTPEFRDKRRKLRVSEATGIRKNYSKSNKDRKNCLSAPEGCVRTTKNIMDTLMVGERFNHTISVASAVLTPQVVLPLDPYCLGAWLGDGSERGGGFTATDSDGLSILKHFKDAGFEFSRLKSPYSWSIKGFTKELRKLNLLKNKHIPEVYLWASREQRLALLQGLMDTDGCATKQGECKFTNTNKSIADGVYHLSSSLGLKPFITMNLSKPVYNKERDTWYGGDVPTWDIKWTATVPVFRLERKLKRLVKKTYRSHWRYITGVEKVGTVTMRCLTTSNPTGLYLFGRNFNVTHNTETVGGIEIQRDQALQRVGCPWNNIQDLFAESARQAVKCAKECRDGKNIAQNIPGVGPVSVNTTNLAGNVLCYAESNPAFPESWAQRETKLIQLITESSSNPSIQQWLFSPANLPALADGIRMKMFKVPGAASVAKQKSEYEILLRTSPVDNPQVMKVKDAVMQATDGMQKAEKSGQQIPPDAADKVQQLTQAAQSLPPFVSSVPVAQDESELHAIEADECFNWMNSSEGQKFKNGTPKQKAGYENVHLHWTEHVAMAKKIAAQNAPPEKPPAESLSAAVDKLPTNVAIQALEKMGIKASPDDFAQHQKDQLEQKVAAKSIPHALQHNT